MAEILDVLNQAKQVVLAYAEANPMRTADFHSAACGCLRCEIDRLEHAIDLARPAPTLADALDVPEVKAMVEAARNVDAFMKGQRAYERSGYGPKLRAALARITGEAKG